MINLSKIIEKYNINVSIEEITDTWNQPWRFYHNLENHLSPMISKIEDLKEQGLDEKDFEILIISAIFHDWYYDPWNTKEKLSMEDRSINYLDSIWDDNFDIKDIIFGIIRATETLKPETKLEELFSSIDTGTLRGSLSEMIKNEKLIMKEYQFTNYSDYKEKRIEFLTNHMELGGPAMSNKIPALIEIIETRVPKIAIYAGTFNPFHNGHLNVLEKAEKIFDKVIIAKGKNDSKNIVLEQFEKEYNNLKDTLLWREIVTYDGLLTDFIQSQIGDITLIRGLRNGGDLEAENKLMFYMTKMYPELKVIYVPSDKEFEYVSSSDIRPLKKYDDFYKQFIPKKYEI